MGDSLRGTIPKKVLIVEDDLLLSAVEKRLIQKCGYKVAGSVRTAQEAIEKTHQLQPDLIIMDIKLLGDMDGVQAMQKIREFSEVPVIYLSGVSDQTVYERAQETRFVDSLLKPITEEDLKSSLEKAFSINSAYEYT